MNNIEDLEGNYLRGGGEQMVMSSFGNMRNLKPEQYNFKAGDRDFCQRNILGCHQNI